MYLPLFKGQAAIAMAVMGVLSISFPAFGIDIAGVQPAALDQPQIHAYLSNTPNGVPLDAAGTGSFNITAYYDTGASGILLSNETADLLSLNRSTYNGQPVIYADVGVSGSDLFDVSDPLYLHLANYNDASDVDNIATYSTVYQQHFGPIRTEIGPHGGVTDPNLQNLDVLGMPALQGKVMVMDGRPVNDFANAYPNLPDTGLTMNTYSYNPGTPFKPDTVNTDPGIPTTDRHVKLSYVSFDQFTTVTPTNAPGPSLVHNPFIGPNPFTTTTDNTPPAILSMGNKRVNATLLLDTGAAASIISSSIAEQLGISYVPGTEGTDNPQLQVNGVPVADEFYLTIGGIGGTKKIAGLFLDNLLLRTTEGDINNFLDARHFNFQGAPFLINDITVVDPITKLPYTLDGILGMNYLVGSALVTDAQPIPDISNLTPSAFNFVTFDEPAGLLGFQLVPEPAFIGILGLLGMELLRRRRPNRVGSVSW